MSRLLVAQRALTVPGWAKDALWRNARAVPSLDLRFADNKSLVDAVTGASLITFTRASSGTFVDSAGVLQTAATDVPRFDHNPTTGESLGLLGEEQRANLLLRSEEFEATWTPTALQAFGSGSVANAIAAPNGSVTADLITENTATTGHRVSQDTISGTAALGAYTASVYFKSKERTRCYLNYTDNATGEVTATFNLSNQSSSITAGGSWTGSLAIIQAVGNNWYRCSLTATKGNSSFALSLRVGIADNSSNISYTGDGTSGLYLWGAQLEAGALPSSYIPTTTAAVTRSASLADLISSAIANNIRSFYVEFSSPAVGTRGAVSLNDNTANERADLLTSGTDPRLVVHDGGAEQVNINGGTVTAGVKARVAVRINSNDFASSINGGAVATDTSGTLPTVDRLMFGRTQAGEYLNGRIARFTGWTGLLPDSTLQALTQ